MSGLLAPADFWKTRRRYCGQAVILKKGGTWLGITKAWEICPAITNPTVIPASLKTDAQLTGVTSKRFIFTARKAADKYLENIKKQPDKYNGYNLILRITKAIYAFSTAGKAKIERWEFTD